MRFFLQYAPLSRYCVPWRAASLAKNSWNHSQNQFLRKRTRAQRFPGNYRPNVRIDFSTPCTEIQGFDLERPSDTCIWTPERVWTQDANGKIQTSRSEPRGAYEGHTRESKWDQLHLTYFMGYALWNYTSIPFALAGPGFECREIEEHWESGYVNSSGVAESWRVLDVTFPQNYHAHTRKQKFYFDREKLWIRRMDYVADVAKGVATHYCFDHRVVNGIVLPMRRRVVRRDPETNIPMVFGPTSFVVDYFDVELDDGSHKLPLVL